MHHHAAAGPAYDAAIEATGAAAADGNGEEAFERADHAVHGTTRQVLSLITNPMDVICRNIRTVREKMATRPDILGCHLGGPFLALKRKGAHDLNASRTRCPNSWTACSTPRAPTSPPASSAASARSPSRPPPTGPPNTSGAPAARWSKLLPAKSTPVPPVFETTSYA